MPFGIVVLLGALIGGAVGIVIYFIRQNTQKKTQDSQTLDSDLNDQNRTSSEG